MNFLDAQIHERTYTDGGNNYCTKNATNSKVGQNY